MNSALALTFALGLSFTAIFRPDIAIRWILATAILVVGTVDYFMPQYAHVSWGVGVAGFFLLIIAIVNYIGKSDKAVDRVTISFALFSLYLIVPILSNINNPFQIIAFGKNIVQYWGFVPLAALGFISLSSREKLIKYFIVILVIQAIVSIYQAAFIVDWANRIAGGDSVVGTFGGTPDGGGSSGAQTIFLTVLIAVFLTSYISSKLKPSQIGILIGLSLIPISLNETKVFFVLMLIVLIYLFITGFNRYPIKTIQIFFLGLSLIVFIFSIYFIYLQHSRSKDSQSIAEYSQRMTASGSGFHIGDGRDASNSRLGSVKFWWDEQIANDKILELFVGYGIGASKFGGVYPGKLALPGSPYYGLKLDRTGFSSLLWDIGLIGTFLFFHIFFAGWIIAVRLRKKLKVSNYERSIVWGLECGIIVLALSNIYDSYFFTNSGLNAFTMLVFALVVAIEYSTRSKSKLII
jgi:hypothetical protein